MEPQERIKAIDKEIIKITILDAPGTVMFGLGLYGKFMVDGDAFHPLLNDPGVVNSLLLVGLAIMVWGGYKVFSLGREKSRLSSESN